MGSPSIPCDGSVRVFEVSGACGVAGLWEPTPTRAASLDSFKKRCEMFATLGLTRIYAPTSVSISRMAASTPRKAGGPKRTCGAKARCSRPALTTGC